MRFSCDIFIEIDIIRAIENQIPFFISENSVILSPGENGVLPIDYFRKVKSKIGENLYTMKYDFAIIINFKDDKIEGFDIFDLKEKMKIREISFKENLEVSELEKFELLTNNLIDMKLFKEKICVSLLVEKEKIYMNFVKENFEAMKYRSFYCHYNVQCKNLIKSDSNMENNIEFVNEFDSCKLKRINI